MSSIEKERDFVDIREFLVLAEIKKEDILEVITLSDWGSPIFLFDTKKGWFTIKVEEDNENRKTYIDICYASFDNRTEEEESNNRFLVDTRRNNIEVRNRTVEDI